MNPLLGVLAAVPFSAFLFDRPSVPADTSNPHSDLPFYARPVVPVTVRWTPRGWFLFGVDGDGLPADVFEVVA